MTKWQSIEEILASIPSSPSLILTFSQDPLADMLKLMHGVTGEGEHFWRPKQTDLETKRLNLWQQKCCCGAIKYPSGTIIEPKRKEEDKHNETIH